jgi:hypothetical protein
MSPAEYIEYQKRPTERALILFEFLRTRFGYSGLSGQGLIMDDMKILKRVIPLIPTDPYYQEVADERNRAVLNGSILKFAKILTNHDRDPFGLATEAGPLSGFVYPGEASGGEGIIDWPFTCLIAEYRRLSRQLKDNVIRRAAGSAADGS